MCICLTYIFLSQVSRQEYGFGMIGSESSPASLFRLYVDYGRYVEATNVLLEYIESLASLVNSLISTMISIFFPKQDDDLLILCLNNCEDFKLFISLRFILQQQDPHQRHILSDPCDLFELLNGVHQIYGHHLQSVNYA